MTSILWLRRDLRRHDHPALGAAARAGDGEVVVVFVVDPALWAAGGPARRAWVGAGVEAVDAAYGGNLTILHGDPVKVIPDLAERVGARSVHVSRETTPGGARRDRRVAGALQDAGVDWVETGTPYAVGPGVVRNQSGDGFKVFTPFSRAWRDHGWPEPATAPPGLRVRQARNDAEGTAALRQAADHPGVPDLPAATEDAALARWRRFVEHDLEAYDRSRDLPAQDATSRMSPYLKLGIVHPRTLLADLDGLPGRGVERYVTELAWREFYADVLWHNPSSAWADLREELSGIAYDDVADVADVAEAVEAWRRGETGYPVVDAGMRQLLHEGWMHNRVRMITASFLTKDLHVWWPVGARHFLDHLIDGDLASNNHGWQWVAGTGTDAAPYFRVFNPVTQGQRFDPEGEYVRRWVPELAHLPGSSAHSPWDCEDGYAHGYPERIVDHAEERKEALRRYEVARGR